MWKLVPVLVLCSLSACSRQDTNERTPTPSTTNSAPVLLKPAVIPAFSGEQAFAYLLKQTSFGPRNPNSSGHEAGTNYLAATLRSFADEVRLQEFSVMGYDNENLRLTNIIASFNPAESTRILLCAHWDTRPRADRDENARLRDKPIIGANDAASGVAVLLELASHLHAQRPQVGIDIILFDGEDYGKETDHSRYLLGSRHFARTKPPHYVPRFGILLDMVGDANLELPREMNSFKSRTGYRLPRLENRPRARRDAVRGRERRGDP